MLGGMIGGKYGSWGKLDLKRNVCLSIFEKLSPLNNLFSFVVSNKMASVVVHVAFEGEP